MHPVCWGEGREIFMKNLLSLMVGSILGWLPFTITTVSELQAQQAEVSFTLRRIEVVDSTILTPAEINQITAPFLNRSLTLAELRQLADQITNIYQQRNYITSRAFIPPDQNLLGGVVKIQVIEGTLERIDISRTPNSPNRLNDDYVRSRLELGAEPPLNFTRLEEELQLLRNDPLIADLKASLVSGSEPSKSILQVRFQEVPSFSANFSFDDYGNVSTGILRAGVVFQELNASGIGDCLSVNYTRSGTADGYGLSYTYPLNPRGGTLTYSFSGGYNPFTFGATPPLQILTTSQIHELTYRQPLVRKPQEEFALSLGFAFEGSFSSLNGVSFNFLDNIVGDGLSQSRVLRFVQDYLKRDTQGAWALRSTFNLGIGFLGATLRNNAADGRFFYWLGQVLRVQKIGGDRDSLAFLRLNFQFADSSLLSLNKFSVGGVQTVRGYRQNQNVGDNGIQASVELQFPILKDSDDNSLVKLHPFVEAGTVWNANGINPVPQTLVSIGLGATYQPIRNLIFRLDVGIPLVNANNPNTNLQDSGIHFSVSGSF